MYPSGWQVVDRPVLSTRGSRVRQPSGVVAAEAQERAALAEGLAAGLQQGLQAAEAARIAAEGAAAEFRTRITAEVDRTAEAERRAAQEGIRAAEASVRAEGAIARAEAAEAARQAFVAAPWWRRLMGRP